MMGRGARSPLLQSPFIALFSSISTRSSPRYLSDDFDKVRLALSLSVVPFIDPGRDFLRFLGFPASQGFFFCSLKIFPSKSCFPEVGKCCCMFFWLVLLKYFVIFVVVFYLIEGNLLAFVMFMICLGSYFQSTLCRCFKIW